MGQMMGATQQYVNAEEQRRTARYNQRIANWMAGDALAEGSSRAGEMKLKGGQYRGAATAAAAHGGVDVRSGSVADVQATTAGMTALDVARIKNQAARQAFGYRTQAWNYREQAEMANWNKSMALANAGLAMGTWLVGAAAGGWGGVASNLKGSDQQQSYSMQGSPQGAGYGAGWGYSTDEYPTINGER